MRFLFLTQYFPPEVGAAQLRLLAVARELRALGHEVEVVTGLPNYPTGRIFPAYRRKFYVRESLYGITVHRLWLYPAQGSGVRRLANYASFTLSSLYGLLRARRPDYLFVESPPLFLGVSAALAKSLWRVPTIFNVADLWPDSLEQLGLLEQPTVLSLAKGLERWSYARATYVNAVTEGIRSMLTEEKGVPGDKVLFLPNGVDTQTFRPQEPDEDFARELGLAGKRVVLYAGTHGYAHGLEVALYAAKHLQSCENVRFVFVGDGSEKARLVRLSYELRLTNVLFLEAAPPETVARLYALASVGLSTLRDAPLFEATRPVKVLTAMATGTPVLYCGAGEGARLVAGARAGLITPPEDARALAEALKRLLAEPALAKEMGMNGRRFTLEHLTWRAVVKDWLGQLEVHQQPSVLPEMQRY